MVTRPPGTAVTAAALISAAGDVEIHRVTVEITHDAAAGMTLLGVPADIAVAARDRIRAAVLNTGLTWPHASITARLEPALPRGDDALDLALALALLAATGQLSAERLAATIGVAALGLDGQLRPVGQPAERLAAADTAGYRRVLVADQQLISVPAAPDLLARSAHTLAGVLDGLRDRVPLLSAATWPTSPLLPGADFADLPHGPTAQLRRITEIAAAGGHHLLTRGQRTGAVLAAERLPRLLPDLDPATAAQASHVLGRVGLVPAPGALARPPWQAPFAETRSPAWSGTLARPGAVPLAHGGVLFIDHPEHLPPAVLGILRRALDHRAVVVRRGNRQVRWPARIQLWLHTLDYPHSAPNSDCTEGARRRFRDALEPVRDRITIQQTLPPLTAWPPDAPAGESTARIAARVAAARARAAARWIDSAHPVGAPVADAVLRRSLPRAGYPAVTDLVDRGELSVRGLHAVLRLAWTIADLAGADRPTRTDLDEAIALRTDEDGAPRRERQDPTSHPGQAAPTPDGSSEEQPR